ncbi:MAG TPA: hypothetical protein VHB02_18380 [Acidimicrobiales bacterium]|nr:hypothetical protein [Acidimicrobiales bacterium]
MTPLGILNLTERLCEAAEYFADNAEVAEALWLAAERLQREVARDLGLGDQP